MDEDEKMAIEYMRNNMKDEKLINNMQMSALDYVRQKSRDLSQKAEILLKDRF
jgi:hypothetical protein